LEVLRIENLSQAGVGIEIGDRLRRVPNAHAAGRHRADDILPRLAVEGGALAVPHGDEQVRPVESEEAVLAHPALEGAGVMPVLWRGVLRHVALVDAPANSE